jgi:predicted  nucleic acid-binding Zn-ribbon protein
MTPDAAVAGLKRHADYANISEDDRALLRAAADLIRTPTDALDEALPTITTADALLTILANPKQYQKALADLKVLVTAAKDERAQAQHAAADLETKRAAIEPELKRAREKAAHQLDVERAAFEKLCSDRQREFVSRESTIIDRERETKAAAAMVVEMKKDLERRLTALREAAA